MEREEMKKKKKKKLCLAASNGRTSFTPLSLLPRKAEKGEESREATNKNIKMEGT